jgi:hypothetical protein
MTNSDALTSRITPENAAMVIIIRRPSRTPGIPNRSDWRRRYPTISASVERTMNATNDAANPSPG